MVRRSSGSFVLLQRQISSVGGILTSVAAVMTMGDARDPLPMRPPMVMVELVHVRPNFLQLWTNFTRWRLSASSVRAFLILMLSLLDFFVAESFDEGTEVPVRCVACVDRI
jgi:hypothetical protein